MSKQNPNPNLWPIIFAVAVFLIAITRGAIIPILIFGYIFYRLFIINTFKNQGIDFFEKFKEQFREPTIDLKPDKKGSFSTSKPFSPIKMPKAKHLILATIGLLIVFVIIDGLVSVPAGNVAVIYDRGRGVLPNELPAGLHLKIPFWQNATIMDVRLQAYTMSIATNEGEAYGDDAIEALTKDGQKVNVDVTVQYRIATEDASYVYEKIGLDYKDKIIRPEVRSVIREVVTGYVSKSLFDIEPRQKAAKQMEDALKARYGSKQIVLESLLLRNIQFSPSYINAIEEKQIAEQRIQKAEYERQEAEKVKETRIIQAQAEAEAIRLKGETLKANPQVIQFEFVQKMAPNINWGILPDGALPLIDLKSLEGNN